MKEKEQKKAAGMQARTFDQCDASQQLGQCALVRPARVRSVLHPARNNSSLRDVQNCPRLSGAPCNAPAGQGGPPEGEGGRAQGDGGRGPPQGGERVSARACAFIILQPARAAFAGRVAGAAQVDARGERRRSTAGHSKLAQSTAEHPEPRDSALAPCASPERSPSPGPRVGGRPGW